MLIVPVAVTAIPLPTTSYSKRKNRLSLLFHVLFGIGVHPTPAVIVRLVPLTPIRAKQTSGCAVVPSDRDAEVVVMSPAEPMPVSTPAKGDISTIDQLTAPELEIVLEPFVRPVVTLE